MFTENVLEKIFSNPKLKDIPFEYQSSMIRVVEEALEELEEEYDAVSKHEP